MTDSLNLVIPFDDLQALPPRRANGHLTFKGNRGVARHGWVRLTPAYGVRLVEQELRRRPDLRTVLDPFCGTGTTALCAATDGREAHTLDLNPFLVWLASVKTSHYTDDDAERTMVLSGDVVEVARDSWNRDDLWEPPISNIRRWWAASPLAALKAIISMQIKVPHTTS